jgi:hypothetical protein
LNQPKMCARTARAASCPVGSAGGGAMVGSTPRALWGGYAPTTGANRKENARARMHVRTHRDRKKTHARRSQEEDSACVGKKTHCWRAR